MNRFSIITEKLLGTKKLPAEAGRFEEIVSVGLKSFGSRFGHLEIVAAVPRFGSVLLTNVFHNRLISDIST